MIKSILLFFALFFTGHILQAQTKTPIIPIPRTISAENIRFGCSLFNDPLNYTTGSSFSFIAPTNNNSNLSIGSGTNLGCMGSVPNQTWFLITVTTAGNLTFNFSNSSNFDVDAVVWGPVSGNNNSNACASTQNAPLTCDYDIGRPDLYIANAQVGQKYVMLVTNYSNSSTTINVSQPTGGSVSYSMINLPNCSQIPTANISGTNTTISEGQSVNLTLSFTGSSPWNYRLSDGTIGTSYTSPINVSVFPTASQTYTINSVSNLCSTNSGTGSVGISVTRNVQLKTCIPLDNNAQDSQNLNNGTLQNGVVISTNRLSEPSKAFQFDGVDDYINLTSNQLNNNTFSFATWVKLDELPDIINPERIALSIGSTNDEHFLGVEFYNGNPAWVFSSNSNKVYSNAVVDLGWHLIIGIRSGGQLKLYIDGVLTGTQNISGFASYGANLSTRIGSSIQSTKFFKGKIDDVKFFNGSLIEPEVLLLQNYNSCNNVFNDTFISVQSVSTSVICTESSFVLRAFTNNILPDGQLQFIAELSNIYGSFSNPTTLGSSSFLPLNVSIPNNISNGAYKVRIRYGGLISINSFDIFVNNPANYNINGTVAINEGQSSNLTLNFTGTGPWSYVMSNGLSGLATTTPWIIPISPDQTTTYSISSTQNICGTATINGNSSATVTVNYSKEFISCMPFNSNALDSKNNNTAVVNGPILTENRYGQTNAAYNFTGSGNYIEYTTNSLRKREYTMSAWVMANLISGSNQYILSQGEIGANTFQGLGVNSSGWFFQSYTSNGLSSIANSTSLSTNQWVHLTAVRTYQSLKLYINGNLVSTTSNSSIIPFKTSDIGRIGANSSTLGNYFNGKIDDVKLFKGALNDEEVFALYSNISDCPAVENASIIVARTISSGTVCAGNNISLGYTLSNVNVSSGSPLTVQLSDASGFFGSPTTLGTGSSSPISVSIPSNTVNSNFYRIRLISAGNVVSVNSIGLIVSGSLPTATISGGGSIPFGGTSSVTINFTGTAPWTFALNNGVNQIANTSPATISVSPFGTTNYTVTTVSNSCGSGTRIGSALVNVAPNISLTPESNIMCRGSDFRVNFTANFTSSPNFRVELSDINGSFLNPTTIGTGTTSPIICLIPANAIASLNYKLRIVSNSPVYSSPEYTGLVLKVPATVSLSSASTILEGDTTDLILTFTGSAPWYYSINNQPEQRTETNPTLIKISPQVNTNYFLSTFFNNCGNAGMNPGSVQVNVNPLQYKLISCFPFNGNANDSKGLNNGTVYGASLTNDRFGNPNSAYSFDGINDMITTSGNGMNNADLTISLWFSKTSEPIFLSYLFGIGSGSKIHALITSGINNIGAYSAYPDFVTSSNPTSLNTWYHAALVRSETTLKLFINGSLVSQTTINNSFAPNDSFSSAIGGGIYNSERYFNGKIDDVQYFRGALSDAQITYLYNSQLNCSDPTLLPFLTLNTLQSNNFCQNQTSSIPFTSVNINPTSVSPINVELSNAAGSFANPISLGTSISTSGNISIQIPSNQTPGTGYKIRLKQGSTISNLSGLISINSPVSGSISGSTTINEGETTNLTLNFSGTAPYTYLITGGTSQSTSLSSVSIPVSPLINTTYQITSLSNTCGIGEFSGSAVISIAPKITLINVSNNYCQGQTFNLSFTSNFTASPNFRAELSNSSGSFSNPVTIGTGSNGNISVTIPNNTIGSSAYKIRIVSDSPVYTSPASSKLTINTKAVSSISGTTTINEGETANLTLNFSGTAPYTYMITGGTSQSTSLSSVSIPVSPLINTTYQITSLENICGTSTGTGSAIITVNPVPIRLVSCFPFNGNVNDSKGLNNGNVLGATISSDRFGNPNSSYNFDGVSNAIAFPTNGLLNHEFSYSLWLNIPDVKVQAMPNDYLLFQMGTVYSTKIMVYLDYLPNMGFGPEQFNLNIITNGISQRILVPNMTFAKWNNLTLVKTSNGLTLYFNGLNVLSNFGSNANINYENNPQIFMGALNNYSNTLAFFGKIDDVQIYKGALTAGQIQALYQNTNPCFDATTYSCLSDNLFTTMLSGQQTLQVSNQIIGRSSIQTNANIHFDSKNSIILEPGFKTESNTVFKATVGGGCN